MVCMCALCGFLLTRRARVQAYSHFQIYNATGDGLFHLPPTFSPEYPGPVGPDANYDLALYRWGLGLALDVSVSARADSLRVRLHPSEILLWV